MPVAKCVALSVVSFGLFEIYWSFQHWKRIGRIEKADLNPLIRALLGPIYCPGLMLRALKANDRMGLRYRSELLTIPLVILYPAFSVLMNIKLHVPVFFSPLVHAHALLFSSSKWNFIAPFTFLVLAQCQRAMNDFNRKNAPNVHFEDSMTRGQFCIAFAGLLLWGIHIAVQMGHPFNPGWTQYWTTGVIS